MNTLMRKLGAILGGIVSKNVAPNSEPRDGQENAPMIWGSVPRGMYIPSWSQRVKSKRLKAQNARMGRG